MEMTIHLRRKLSLFMLVMAIIACSPSKNNSDKTDTSSASFNASKVNADKRVLERDELNHPKLISYTFSATINHIASNELIKNRNFEVVNSSGDMQIVSTDNRGVLYWSEGIQVNFSDIPRNLLLTYKVKGIGLIKGYLKLDLVISPWDDVLSGASHNQTVVDLRLGNVNFPSNSLIKYEDYLSSIHQKSDDKNNEVATETSSNTFMVLDDIGIRLRKDAGWYVSNSLHAEVIKQLNINLLVKYKNPNSPDGQRDSYLRIPDGDYKVTTSVIRSFSETASFGNPTNQDPKVVFVTSDQGRVKSIDGRLRYDARLAYRDFRLLKARSLLVVDVEPIGSSKSFGFSGQRFISEISVADGEVKPISALWMNQKELDSFDKIYHTYLEMPLHSIFNIAKSDREVFFNTVNSMSNPVYYANRNQLNYITLVGDKENEDERNTNDFFSKYFQSYYKNNPLRARDFMQLCDYWADNLFKDENLENNTERVKSRLKRACWSKLKDELPPLFEDKGVSFRSPEQFISFNEQPLFLFRPMWTNFDIDETEVKVTSGRTDNYTLSSFFYASRAESHISGEDYRVFGTTSGSIPNFGFSAGATAGKFWTWQTERRKGRESHSTNAVWLAAEKKTVKLQTSRVQKCLIARINPDFLQETMDRITSHFFGYGTSKRDWKVIDRGLLICDQTRELNKPLDFEDNHYFFSQIFSPNVTTDRHELSDQPWLLFIRGDNQLESFKRFFNMKIGTHYENIPNMNPSAMAYEAYEKFRRIDLPVYPGIYVPNQSDIENLNQLLLNSN